MAKKKATKKKASFELVYGDCLDEIWKLGKRDVDLVFADPPYNIDYSGYADYEDNLPLEDYVDWCREWMSACYTYLKKTGSFWLAIGDEYVSELDVAAKAIGFHKRSHVIWHYTFGVACSKNFARSHTHLLYYTKHKSQFVFNVDDKKIRVPSARQLKYNDKRANPKGKLPDNTWVLHPDALKKCFGPDEDTWLVSRVCGTFHERQERGTYQEEKAVPQMPEEIMERIILACSKPGQLVIDPFGGTFTTGAVAVRHNRNFWGCDITKAYVERAKLRLQRAAAGR